MNSRFGSTKLKGRNTGLKQVHRSHAVEIGNSGEWKEEILYQLAVYRVYCVQLTLLAALNNIVPGQLIYATMVV